MGIDTMELLSSSQENRLIQRALAYMTKHFQQDLSLEDVANVFTDHVEITMSNATADVDIRYTTDGSEPALESPLYTAVVRRTTANMERNHAAA